MFVAFNFVGSCGSKIYGVNNTEYHLKTIKFHLSQSINITSYISLSNATNLATCKPFEPIKGIPFKRSVVLQTYDGKIVQKMKKTYFAENISNFKIFFSLSHFLFK